MSRRWVVNASPLIALAKISQINLLSQLCNEIVIPSGVVQEINIGPDDDRIRAKRLDRAAKNAALVLGVPVRGTLGVILQAKLEGIISAAKPVFEQLAQIGFRVSPEVLAAALRLVNE